MPETTTAVIRPTRRRLLASFTLADLAMKRPPHPVPTPGRSDAPSGAPEPCNGLGGEDSLVRLGGGYVIRCAAGMPTEPAFYPQGKFLSWLHGLLIPCCRPEFATHYDTREVARAVAARAEQAFPGSRFEVMGAQGAWL